MTMYSISGVYNFINVDDDATQVRKLYEPVVAFFCFIIYLFNFLQSEKLRPPHLLLSNFKLLVYCSQSFRIDSCIREPSVKQDTSLFHV